MILIGVDTGGTFTDFVVLDSNNQSQKTYKTLSTPNAPEQAILTGLEALDLLGKTFLMVHGSTVATNAVLEGKGVSTVYIANKGFTDVLTIGRQARKELYNLTPAIEAPPVKAEYCLPVSVRRDADGKTLQPLTDSEINSLVADVKRLQPEAVAVNLLFSFLAPEDEKRIADALSEQYFVSLSSGVLPEYREYERGIATWLNAYVGPKMQDYLLRLKSSLGANTLAIMQSTGGTIAAEQAANKAVNLLLSGPAGGLMAAKAIGERLGEDKILTFDMGGTSTDVSLINGDLQLSTECKVAGYPVAVPMVDIHTIGAGGGSIASIDDGGALRVGPESAGAYPGPVCYGQGGKKITVTDANFYLGRLPDNAALGGSLRLDKIAVQRKMQTFAKQMGCDTETAARGVIELTNEHMAQALRVISVQRGEDPREYALMAFGGAAGLHVCALAEILQVTKIVVPENGGVLSAQGMLVAPVSRQKSAVVNCRFSAVNLITLEKRISELLAEAEADLATEHCKVERQKISLDCRYQGQSHCLSVPLSLPISRNSLDKAELAFHEQHKQRYGHNLQLPVELVTLRLSVESQRTKVELAGGVVNAPEFEKIDRAQGMPIYHRAELAVGASFTGPAIVVEDVSTLYVAAGWKVSKNAQGDLLLDFLQA